MTPLAVPEVPSVGSLNSSIVAHGAVGVLPVRGNLPGPSRRIEVEPIEVPVEPVRPAQVPVAPVVVPEGEPEPAR